MRAHHSYEALNLALRMDAMDAAKLVILHQGTDALLPRDAPSPFIEPLHLEAARIVCEWVDTYGPFPSVH